MSEYPFYEGALKVLLNFFNVRGGATTEEIREIATALDHVRLKTLKVEDSTVFRVPRLPWNAHWMLEAAVAATRSTCDRGPELLLDPGRHGVGAIFVRDHRVVAGGYNGSPPGQPHCNELVCPICEYEAELADVEVLSDVPTTCPECGDSVLRGGHVMRDGSCVRTLHAEENALIQCALDGVSPRGVTVYTTASPCYDCTKRLVRVGARKVVFGAAYESRYGLSGDALFLLRDAGVAVEHLDLREHLRLGGVE
jgi:dCMP deaminase